MSNKSASKRILRVVHRNLEKADNRRPNSLHPEILRGDVSSKAIGTTRSLATKARASANRTAAERNVPRFGGALVFRQRKLASRGCGC
jgi:hypothetical protein